MYSIRFDADTHILHLRLEGFWSEQTLAAFTAELLRTITALRAQHRRYAVLSDSRQFGIQSPEVSQGFERIMAHGATANPSPTAIVVAGVLNKMQVERTMKSDRLRAFLNEADARAWLVAEMERTV